MEINWKKQGGLLVILAVIVGLFLLAESSTHTTRNIPRSVNKEEASSYPPVRLHRFNNHVVMANGIASVTLSTPKGFITGIEYNGIDNLLEYNKEANRGYWDMVWSTPNSRNTFDELETTTFRVIKEDENQIELSFVKTWNPSVNGTLPLNIDKRFIMLRGRPGFYTYAIYEHLEGWPDLNIAQSRVTFKLQHRLFHYMALADRRQRVMPTEYDRVTGRTLAYKEAVLLTNPSNSDLKGEVDDKYQYSSDIKDNRVHGWICNNPPTGFWVITPSDEFRVGGPLKQELTSHVGPTSLAMFFSGHYTGETSVILRNGEAWKKVFGPVFIYLNSASSSNEDNNHHLWKDAKEQMLIETKSWPYDFPLSKDYPHADQRGTVSGQLLVRDRYINKELMAGRLAHVGLAPPGDAGSWQRETKGYQFWTQADADGYFLIKGVRPGNYSLNAWVPGILGNYQYHSNVIITPGQETKLNSLVYEPPRRGPTVWEIGVPDRTASEFYVPDPYPTLMNHLYVNHTDKFRQYGLWAQYTDLYPDNDLIYTVGESNYKKDWFYAHVNRNTGNNTYESTTWQIVFDLPNVNYRGFYTLQLALASANGAELQVRVNDPYRTRPNFSTRLIGRDNAIARHGIHGLHWFYSVDLPAFNFQRGRNTIYLRQSRAQGPFTGLMYDYLRLEGPPETN